MRLALIRQRYNAFGGAERFIERATRALSAEGSVALTLIAREWNGDADEPARLRRCDPFYLGRTWRDWSFARAACDIASGDEFDLVQSHERIACCDIYRAGDGVHAQWLANRSRALGPLRRFAQCVSPWHRYTLAAERRLFASSRLKMVVCNSRMVAGELRAHYRLSSDKLRVIYNGVDLARFHPALRMQWRGATRKRLAIPADAIVHLFLGSGFERKGVATLLEAFSCMGDQPHRHLIIVGADRHAPAFEARSRSLGLAGRVHFAGAQADPCPWYGAADAFVLPTLYDPFPNAVLEAMACGLPAITSTQSGAAELINAGNGWVCDALDTRLLAQHLAALNHDNALRMGAAARATAERYSLETMAASLIALYRELLIPLQSS